MVKSVGKKKRAASIVKKGGRNAALTKLPFTVASALLRELGERLVGKPHIALAELVKNSYDADSKKVIIRFLPGMIEVSDNGDGMNFAEFRDFWMRIGSPHKQSQRVSRRFKRPMTGSKGVGRLAVQFLASKIEIRTVSEKNTKLELVANVDWDLAVKAGDLTEAVAYYQQISRVTEFPDKSPHGTTITLTGLNQSWTPGDFENLAREIWWLQPPFQSNPELSSEEQKTFGIELVSPEADAVQKFDFQMRAYLDLWHARLVGKLVTKPKVSRGASSTVQVSLEFADGNNVNWEYSASDLQPAREWTIHSTQFEIRIFHLRYRQKHGIPVQRAQDYLNQHGGIHVYDAGFHLPYYGPDTDWLETEMDHSHRRARSKLLPDAFQVPDGLTFLPTMSRMLGVVHVNTSKERTAARSVRGEKAKQYLTIQVSRDRLVDNMAFQGLKDMVRASLDFYAMREAERAFREAEAKRDIEPVRKKFERVDDVLALHKKEIPQPVFEELRSQVKEAIDASDAESKAITQQVGLLGSLATAGMSALAYEHEVVKQLNLLEEVTEELSTIRVRDDAARRHLDKVGTNLSEWIERARATRALFSSLMDEENRTVRSRFKAKTVVDQVRSQMDILLRGVDIDSTAVDDSLRLPEGSFAEWSAILQNVFLNAVNAMLDSKTKMIVVKSSVRGLARHVLVQDTGRGVQLKSSEDLFKPFVRKSKLSRERRALGLGGTGLGLAIVRMIAEHLNCKAAFVEPDRGFKTAFRLSWNEVK